MSCSLRSGLFRLLDHLVGWDPDSAVGLRGLSGADGIHLQRIDGGDSSLDEATLSCWIPPARLARGCDPCIWYLVTPCPPQSRLLRRSGCEPCWSEPMPGAPDTLVCANAVAVAPDLLAVSDSGAGAILFFSDGGRRQLGRIDFAEPGPIAYANWHEWLVLDRQHGVVRRLDISGVDLGTLAAPLPADAARIERIAVDQECRVWLAQRLDNGLFQLWCAERGAPCYTPSDLDALRQVFAPNGLRNTGSWGFCFVEDDAATGMQLATTALQHAVACEPQPVTCGPCFSWYGRGIQPPAAAAAPAIYVNQGQLLTLAIDSGVPRCRWHRLRVDADIPSGTTVAIAVSSQEDATPPHQGIASGFWSAFPPGAPHPADWQEANLNSRDFLIQQPPGRYLFVRLRLTSDGQQTPSVRRLRLDFPRLTSLNQLPYVFRGYGYDESGGAEDFSERFLSLFDAYLENLDTLIERVPALLDSGGVPDELLPWLGEFFDIAMDPVWEPERRRRILQAAPKLYRMRGTLDGMRVAVQLVFDVDPVLQELSLQRPWGAIGRSRLNAGVRLFGHSNWRFRLGRSQLSRAPLRSFGNPDRDPFNALAHRINLLLPLALDTQQLQRLTRLVEAQKPAHCLVAIRTADGAFILGRQLNLGIDTGFKPTALSVLGDAGQPDAGGLRLGQASVLATTRSKAQPELVIR